MAPCVILVRLCTCHSVTGSNHLRGDPVNLISVLLHGNSVRIGRRPLDTRSLGPYDWMVWWKLPVNMISARGHQGSTCDSFAVAPASH